MAIQILSTIAFSEAQQQQIQSAIPDCALAVWNVKSALEVPPDVWAATEVLYTGHILPEKNQAPALKWVQSHFAGIDSYLDSGLFDDGQIQLTTLSGAAVPQIAEYALTMLLALGHKLPQMMEDQKRAEWPRDRFEKFSPFVLSGRTIGLVGYGSIGREVARLVKHFGCKVLATKYNLMKPDDKEYSRAGHGDPGSVLADRLYPPQALASMLQLCDFVIVTVPLTEKTLEMFNAATFAAMKPGAYFIVLSRGETFIEKDLIAALNDGPLAGAALDVFPQEPLPKNSALWAHPKVIITPHICGISPNYTTDALELFIRNLKIFQEGQPLLNLYDKVRGY